MSPSGPEDHPAKCNCCGKDAKEFCKGCKEDPDVSRAHAKTYYCGPSCQKSDWAAHKDDCLHVRLRQDLYRVGDLLQETFYTYRETIFDGEVNKVEEKDGKLIVHFMFNRPKGYEPRYYAYLPVVYPFPKDLVKNLEDRHSILTLQCCNDAIALMHDLTKFLLDGLYEKVSEVTLEPKNNKREILTVDSKGLRENKNFSHEILQIYLARGAGVYMMDLSGAQFGHHEPVTSFKDYQDNRAAVEFSRQDFGLWKVKFGQEPSRSYDGGNFHMDWVINQEASKCLLITTKDWMKENQMTVKKLLRLDPGVYEISKKSLQEKLVLNILDVLVAMGRHYAEEKQRCNGIYEKFKNFKLGE